MDFRTIQFITDIVFIIGIFEKPFQLIQFDYTQILMLDPTLHAQLWL